MKTKFECRSCRHVFSRSFKPEQCPQCGQRTVYEYQPTRAQDILDELERM